MRMTSPPTFLTLASRASRLALWQAEHVRTRLQAYYPDCRIDILGITTQGDRLLDGTLAKLGGKGLFVKELEHALEHAQADLAVHSLKDMPTALPPHCTLAAVLERESPFDAFVCPTYDSLEDLPLHSIVGTSSLRREAIVRYRFPGLRVQSLRGNVDTRLGKLDRGDYSAIILAAAGLNRLGLQGRIRTLLSAETSLPAVGQGALAVETLAHRSDLISWVQPLQHLPTSLATSAERALAQALGSTCQSPVAAYADWKQDGSLRLRAMLGLPDGSRQIQAVLEMAVENIFDAEILGQAVAQSLFAKGAEQILASLSS
jgi:hydroxymethylbilane synthase